MKARHRWFLGFAAVFAALAAWLFWGTWSLDFAPVMPDCPIIYAPNRVASWWRGWVVNGKFAPNDLRVLLGSPYFWQELQYALALFFAALGMAYFLLGRGASRLASYGAGLLLAFSGYWCTLFSAGHLGWFFCTMYILFPFGLLDRAIRKGKVKNWLLLGATVGWASYWQTDLWLLFVELIGVYFIYRCVCERRLPWKGMLLAAVSMFAIGGAGFRSALVDDLAGRDKQIEEGQTVAQSDKVDEAEKRWIFTTNWSLPPAEVAEFFLPRLNGDTSCPMTLSLGARYGTGITQYTGALGRPKDAPSGNYRQHSLYVGVVTCLLALFGLVSGVLRKDDLRRRGDIIFFGCAALVCCLLAMGRFCEPIYRIFYALPFGNYLRAPVKWHHLTEFCLCVLAGYGIAGLEGLSVWKVWKIEKIAPWFIGVVVLAGAIDLVRVDHLYCAPVDLTEARRQNCNFQMTFLRKADFNNPQVAAMVQQKKIVALAQPNPETYLVGVLTPWGKPTDAPFPPLGVAAWLSVLSMVASLGVAAYAVKKA